MKYGKFVDLSIKYLISKVPNVFSIEFIFIQLKKFEK